MANKLLHNKAFNITKNPKYDRYQRELASIVYKLFDKRSSSSAVKSENMLNQNLSEELHKSIIRKLEKWKVHLSFIDNILRGDLVDRQLISKFNKEYLVCVIDVYTKYTNFPKIFKWV